MLNISIYNTHIQRLSVHKLSSVRNFLVTLNNTGATTAQSIMGLNYGLDNPRTRTQLPAKTRDCCLSSMTRPGLGPTNPPIQ
jgi:hypothetical protein